MAAAPSFFHAELFFVDDFQVSSVVINKFNMKSFFFCNKIDTTGFVLLKSALK